jgi:acetyl-CoA carboxylase carboxyltransferase component
MRFDDELQELREREARALAMGGPERLARRERLGLWNARSRIDAFIDPGTFVEAGLLAVSSVVPEDRARTPADGKVTGFAKVDGRMVGIVSNDFTVKGASSSLTNMKKIAHVKRVATERGFPLVFFGESSGARMSDNMGARGMGTNLGNDPQQYVRLRETPWASAILGQCYGSSAWYACLADFAVMRKGAVMAVASSGLASYAVGQRIEAEELGRWPSSNASYPTCLRIIRNRRPARRCLHEATKPPSESSMCCPRAASEDTRCARSSSAWPIGTRFSS